METQNRIKKNQEFNKLYKRSKRFYNRDFKILVSESGENYPRFGFTITKKYGKANKRNKIRRRLKEIIRLNIDIFANKDYIVVPKSHTIDMDYKDLEKSLKHVIAISKKENK